MRYHCFLDKWINLFLDFNRYCDLHHYTLDLYCIVYPSMEIIGTFKNITSLPRKFNRAKYHTLWDNKFILYDFHDRMRGSFCISNCIYHFPLKRKRKGIKYKYAHEKSKKKQKRNP